VRECSTARERPTGPQPAPARKPGILVADDDGFIRQVVTVALSAAGLEVWCVANGREAVEAYLANGTNIDLVLLDVHMPVLDGPAALLAIKAINANVCCCVMTGKPDEPGEDNLLRLGARRVFVKPFAIHGLTAALRELLPEPVLVRPS
jgi:DNA-binding response OmpR family regulator